MKMVEMMSTPEPPEPEGAEAPMEFDRMTIERFRSTFPNARWSDERQAWWVPGKTAGRRIARWRALEQSRADVHADAKGRDAFAFDPIVSDYLEAQAELIVRTPYSRSVVDELRQIPFARWDDVRKAWVIPFRGYEELRRRWPEIEEAARRAEPTERRRRREEAKGTDAWHAAQGRTAERRKRRFPVPVDDMPPSDRPVSTSEYGVICFLETSGELVESEALSLYPSADKSRDLVWARWRPATLEELIHVWAAKSGPSASEIARGWWLPTKPELVDERKAAKSRSRQYPK
jgi:hypothetical protein